MCHLQGVAYALLVFTGTLLFLSSTQSFPSLVSCPLLLPIVVWFEQFVLSCVIGRRNTFGQNMNHIYLLKTALSQANIADFTDRQAKDSGLWVRLQVQYNGAFHLDGTILTATGMARAHFA